MDIFDIIISIASLTVLISIVLALFSLKRYIENLISEEKAEIKADLEAWLNSDKGKAAIYNIGLLLGNAIKTGVGISAKGGKFKLEDIIAQGAGALLGKVLGIPIGGSGEQPQERQEQQEKLPKM